MQSQTVVGTVHNGHAIALDDAENIYLAADLETDDFPVSQNAFRTTGPATAVMKIIPQDACDPKPGFVLLEHEPGGDLPPSQEIELSCVGGPFVYAVRDADWLVVSQDTDGGAKLIVSVKQDALPEETSIGTIDIKGTADDSIRSIPVKLRVENPAFRVRPRRIELTALLGDSASTISGFIIQTEGGAVTSVRIDSSAPEWLEPRPGPLFVPQLVQARTRNLSAGTYDAILTVTPVGLQADPIEVAVRLDVIETYFEDPVTPLVFRYRTGESDPAPRTIQLRIVGLEHAFQTEKLAASPWLIISPALGVTPSDLHIEVRPAGLKPGVYEDAIEITARNRRTSFRESLIEAKTVQVPLEIEEGEPIVPQVSAAGIVNAADYRPAHLTGGEIVVAFGDHFGPETLKTLRITAENRVDTTLAATQVLVDGIPAPIIFAVAKQVAFQVPFEVSGERTVVIEFEGRRSNTIVLGFKQPTLGVFTADASGVGSAAALNQDGTINSDRNPARRGTIVSAFLSGVGHDHVPSSRTGEVGTTSSGMLRDNVRIAASVGGQPAEIQYAGQAPTLLSGVTQMNIKIREDAPTGSNVPLEVVFMSSGSTSQPNLTLAIQ